MESIVCLVIGYLFGSASPAALLSKIKNVDLKSTGTKNLGASNALLVLGRSAGVIVMVVDICKAFFAAKIAQWLYPKLAVAGMLAAFAAILGHVFPFYMHFQGGKGLAAFGGMVCFFDSWLLVFYLSFGLLLIILVNYSVALPLFAGFTFPIVVWYRTGDIWQALIAAAGSLVILVKHWSNIGKARRGEETKIRDIIRTKVLKKG